MFFLTGVFINPTNAKLEGSSFTLTPTPVGAAEDYFYPPLTSYSGSNYFDREKSTLFLVVRGSEPVEIRTVPAIQVRTVV